MPKYLVTFGFVLDCYGTTTIETATYAEAKAAAQRMLDYNGLGCINFEPDYSTGGDYRVVDISPIEPEPHDPDWADRIPFDSDRERFGGNQ
jgi:hypothetical protein